jgi:transposase InsO family protein
MKAFDRFKFICAAHPGVIHVFNDHANLKYVLHPDSNTSKTTLGRLHRWAITLSEFNFEVIHTPSEDNFFADCLSRWAADENFSRSPSQAAMTVSSISFTRDGDAKWLEFIEDRLSFLSPAREGTPPLDRISLYHSQERLFTSRPSMEHDFLLDGNPPIFIHCESRKILVPVDMTEKILVALHIAHGHPSPTKMKELARDYHFIATNIALAIDNLCRLCLHCDFRSRLVRRPYGITRHASSRGEILHMDYLYMAPQSYLLVITDDVSRKVELVFTQSADANTAAQAITYWAARYGIHSSCTIMTDCGSHFCAQLLEFLLSLLRIRHDPTVVYSPWTNGSAEVENRLVIRLFRSLCSEFRLDYKSWPSIIPTVMYLLNNEPCIETGLSPNQVYLGEEFQSSILPSVHESELLQPKDPEAVKRMALELKEELCRIAFKVSSLRDEIRAEKQKRLNQRKGVNDIQFQPGDFVWVSSSGASKGRGKTRKVWQAPFQIDEILSPFRYRVRDLTGKTQEVHVQRLRFYDGSQFTITTPIKEQFIFDNTSFEVDSIQDVRWNRDLQRYELKVRWAGFEPCDDTWEPLSSLHQEIPDIVRDFLHSTAPSNRTAQSCLDSLASQP